MEHKTESEIFPLILTRQQAARMLGARSIRFVDKLAAEGVLRRVRLPDRVRAIGVLRDDVERVVREAVVTPAAPGRDRQKDQKERR